MSGTMAELSSAFTKGLQVQYERQYDIARRTMDERLKAVAGMTTSDGQSEKYHIWNTVPRLARWRPGQAIPSGGFDGVQFEVENFEWGREIVAHKNAVADDRTRSFMDGVRLLAQDKPMLIERLVFQVLKGGTDTDGLDSIPNAADGVALFSTTGADGNARYGVTDGNLLTRTGTAVADRRTDYYRALQQWLQMQDPSGRPLISEQAIEQAGVLIMFPASALETFEEAFVQKLGTTPSAASAPSNPIKDAQRKLVLWPTQFLTGSSFYVQLMIDSALFVQDREAMTIATADINNSDRARREGKLAFQASTRLGIGVKHAFPIIKVN